jgi:formylmethanofuran dehydrogenase subunit E
MVAVVENDSCAVDAVQVMTGCTFGKGNLVHRDYGKQVYTFIRRPSGHSMRIAVNWTSPPESPDETAAWEAYRRGNRSEDVLRLVHARKSRKLQAVLDAPDDELLSVSRGRSELPPVARIHPSVTCATCGEKVMEPRARLRDGRILCLPCFRVTSEEAVP